MMTAAEADDHAALQTALRDVIGAMGDAAEPCPGSPAAEEMAVDSRAPLVATACSQAHLLQRTAVEYLELYVRSLDPVLTIAFWGAGRGVLEASARCLWLCKRNIEPTERIARSLSLRYEDTLQQERLARCTGQAVSLEPRRRHLIEQARAHGLDEVVRDDRRVAVGRTIPTITDLVRAELDMEAPFRVFSGALHGASWLLTQVSMSKAPAQLQPEESEAGWVHLMPHFDFGHVLWVSFHLAKALMKAESQRQRFVYGNVTPRLVSEREALDRQQKEFFFKYGLRRGTYPG